MKQLKNAIHLTEFYIDPVTREQKNGTCTDTSATVCMIIVDGVPVTLDQAGRRMLNLADTMFKLGLGAENGAATIQGTASMMVAKGYKLDLVITFEQPITSHNWKQLLQDYAGEKPIVLQVANGKALKDMATGSKPECVTLRYHAIAVIGIDNTGAYLCVDGDNPEVSQKYQTYSEEDLELAQPCGMIIFAMKVKAMQLPTYAHDTGTLIRYDGSSETVSGGFRRAMISGQVPWMGMVRTPEEAVPDVRMNGTRVEGKVQYFEYGVLCAESQTGKVYALQTGDLLLAMARGKSPLNALTNLGVK